MFVVVVVWFCCSSWLAFLTLACHNNLMLQFLLHWVICFGGYLIVHSQFFWKILGLFWVFWGSQKIIFGFSICSSFSRQLCQNCGWAGSELYVPSHIAELPCWWSKLLLLIATLVFSASYYRAPSILYKSSYYCKAGASIILGLWRSVFFDSREALERQLLISSEFCF